MQAKKVTTAAERGCSSGKYRWGLDRRCTGNAVSVASHVTAPLAVLHQLFDPCLAYLAVENYGPDAVVISLPFVSFSIRNNSSMDLRIEMYKVQNVSNSLRGALRPLECSNTLRVLKNTVCNCSFQCMALSGLFALTAHESEARMRPSVPIVILSTCLIWRCVRKQTLF